MLARGATTEALAVSLLLAIAYRVCLSPFSKDVITKMSSQKGV